MAILPERQLCFVDDDPGEWEILIKYNDLAPNTAIFQNVGDDSRIRRELIA
jgi:hypothetical protein